MTCDDCANYKPKGLFVNTIYAIMETLRARLRVACSEMEANKAIDDAYKALSVGSPDDKPKETNPCGDCMRGTYKRGGLDIDFVYDSHSMPCFAFVDKARRCPYYIGKPLQQFRPGGLVMRKDGKAFKDGKYIECVHVIGFADEVFVGEPDLIAEPGKTHPVYHYKASELTLVPAKPAPEDIKGYEMTGEFRPPKLNEPYYDGNCGIAITIWEGRLPVWILRRKREKKRVEFETKLKYHIIDGQSIGAFDAGFEQFKELPLRKPCKITIEYEEE